MPFVGLCCVVTSQCAVQNGINKEQFYLWGDRVVQSIKRLDTGYKDRELNAGGQERFSVSVQTGPGAHPASFTKGTGPGVERLVRGVNHTLPPSAEVEEIYLRLTNKMQSYTMVLITIHALHVSGGFSSHHQELKTV